MDKNKLFLPVAIVLASIILGGFYYASELIKQQYTREQQRAKTEQDRKIALFNCIATVDNKWSAYILSLNPDSTEAIQIDKEGIPPAQQTEIDNCNKEYK